MPKKKTEAVAVLDPRDVSAENIRKLHDGIGKNLKRTLEDAIEIGRLLSKIKAELAHGEFESWCRKKLPFNKRTGEHYMKFYTHRAKLLKNETVSHLGIRSAIKMLRPPNAKPTEQHEHEADTLDFDNEFPAADKEPVEVVHLPKFAAKQFQLSISRHPDGFTGAIIVDETEYPIHSAIFSLVEPGETKAFIVRFSEVREP